MMRKLLYNLTLFFFSISILGQDKIDDKLRDKEFYNATNNWFYAWKLVSKDIYKINNVRPVDFIFFDDKYVYSTSMQTVINGTHVKGHNLMNLKFQWKKKLHNNSLILPDKSVITIGIMSFAANNAIDNKPFFVMPLPNFWKQKKNSSKELGLENLITGIFIHEFSHSQQMQNFGKKISEFEKQNDFPFEFNDNIIQNLFSKDTTYVKLYREETEMLYNAVNKKDLDKNLVKQALSNLTQRQKEYFKENYINLVQIDDFFLTMEGFGQYSMFLWLKHPKGGNIKKETAIRGVRRGGKWWSQDEGFALFLILDELTSAKNWAKDMFGNSTESSTNLIYRYMN
ncbi:hypothetical protein [Empedobacter sedimenti]|uniref:hypothetical protein n=1 Tax=Empedobacter sedimenti TaxID=3042610 RepID=UPI0024A6302F|nr:hypothetical protein [Empedobacter sedimenti]